MLNLYGYRVEENDRYIDLGLTSVRHVSDSAEHYFFLDVFPWLRHIPEWVPFINFTHVAKVGRKISHALLFELYDLTKKRNAKGDAIESMASVFLAENTQDDGAIKDEKDFCAAAATLFIGGADTTVTAMMTFVLSMLKTPDVQRLAQQEIDQVVGTDRLPTFDDKKNLPYVQAVCAEVLKHAVITPLGLPHLSTSDDNYKGFNIPAGTTVFANIWKMSNDPKLTEDPTMFKPERWLSREDGKDAGVGLHPRNYIFGFGRRICAGQKWAENFLFIIAASMLAAFNIERAIGEDGKPIAPNEDYLQAFVRTLGPSKCKFTPRSKKMASLIRLSVEVD
ncbi:cytochrome P450 [Schizopora paradoxa]|uniref:Cytochrome P450 n=1 Tax=Schizopora paradoxa TaxID=27342 RepID=A0A0H2RMX0_9AGAM|nr:cytochrome P450 [Schizopora paradoxa]